MNRLARCSPVQKALSSITKNNRFSISHALERATHDDWDDGGATPIEGLCWATMAEQLSLWLESRLARARACKALHEPAGSARQLVPI
jgi:hypothetical protein